MESKKKVAPKTTSSKLSDKYDMIEESLNFHDFEHEPILECRYERTMVIGKKDDKDIEAHVVFDININEKKYLSTSYTINKTIETLKKLFPKEYTSKVIYIEFLEKTEVNGKPFNRFKTGIIK